jgi:hypothetical protein
LDLIDGGENRDRVAGDGTYGEAGRAERGAHCVSDVIEVILMISRIGARRRSGGGFKARWWD